MNSGPEDTVRPMKCLVTQPIHESGLAKLRLAGIEPIIARTTQTEVLRDLIADCDGVITRNFGLPADLISAAPRLRVISVHGAGHEQVDKPAADKAGIIVCNAPGANARSVSELTIALALAAARLILPADRAARLHDEGFRDRSLTRELFGKNALIVGWGATGKGVGKILRDSFGMTVTVYSPRSPEIEPGFHRSTDLGKAVAQADLISLHTNLRPETRHMISSEILDCVKPGAIFVNVARAGLVDEEALVQALQTGKLHSAALDVYSDTAPEGPLGQMDNVILTPHLGGATEESMIRVADRAVENLLDVLCRNQRPEATVNNPGSTQE